MRNDARRTLKLLKAAEVAAAIAEAEAEAGLAAAWSVRDAAYEKNGAAREAVRYARALVRGVAKAGGDTAAQVAALMSAELPEIRAAALLATRD
jgi:hypothetical protein